MPDISERLIKSLADFLQFQTLEVEQLKRSALHWREIVKRRQQLREIDSETHLALNVVLPL
jgi:hypothetical protein